MKSFNITIFKSFLIILFNFCNFFLIAQDHDFRWWGTDNRTYALGQDNDYIYVGENPRFPNSKIAIMDETTGFIINNLVLPQPNGKVTAVVDDGQGGWFIGGDFTQISGVIRNRLAHIKSDGSLDLDWNVVVNSTVTLLYRLGNDLFVGGEFITQIGGTFRTRIAKLNASTGLVDSNWIPNPNGRVNRMTVYGNVLIMAGDFTSIRNTSVGRIAKVNNTDGQVLSWGVGANAGLIHSKSCIKSSGLFIHCRV
jgi:hypothetical protein